MASSTWAWVALLGGAIVVAAVSLCYSKEESPTVSDPFAGVQIPRLALVMR